MAAYQPETNLRGARQKRKAKTQKAAKNCGKHSRAWRVAALALVAKAAAAAAKAWLVAAEEQSSAEGAATAARRKSVTRAASSETHVAGDSGFNGM
jgi:hypothetical protein